MQKLDLTHPCPWNRDKRVGVGIDFGHVKSYPGGYHYGIDFYAPVGEDIVAAYAGTVVHADDTDDSDYGKHVILDHGNEIYTVYVHLDEFWVDVGDELDAGEALGTCGNTGNTVKRADDPEYGSHLHFEVRVGANSKRNVVDPMEWIKPRPDFFSGAKLRWK